MINFRSNNAIVSPEMTDIKSHEVSGKQIAEVISPVLVLRTVQDGIDLVGNLAYQGFDGVILHAHHVTPAFFDLQTGLAGEILQKFSNYRMRLAVVGDFSMYESTSLQAFIAESNRGGAVHFVGSVEEGVRKLGISRV
jgi:hypothetical protein